MSIQELRDLVSPPKAQHDLVMSWLKESGISSLVSYGDAIEGTSTVSNLEKVLQTQFFMYKHQDGRKAIKLWGDYSIPEHLVDIVESIHGVNDFAPPRPTVKRPTQKRGYFDAYCYVVPQTVWGLYGIPKGTKVTNSSQGVIEWEQQYYTPADLTAFGTNMGVPAIAPVTVVGSNFPSGPGVEAELDIQWIAATGVGAQNWFWIEAGSTWLYGFSVHFMNTAQVPLIASMSYGWNEEDQCEAGIGGAECNSLGLNSTQYVARVNTEFQKIGLRGVSLFSASGDSGCNGRTDPDCSDLKFHPPYPAASPFVTAVGATQLVDVLTDLQNPPPVCSTWDPVWWCASGGDETAVSYSLAGFASGGGFSEVAPQPSWQKEAVSNWMNSAVGHKTPTSYYNKGGRAFPDIAALGNNILIWTSGAEEPVGGTSASSPISAGIFALVNDYVIAKTRKPLGPLNQLIYKMAVAHPKSFHDITVGDNVCTESGCSSSCHGFYCGVGWDPVSGWGSPNYSEIINYLKTQPKFQ